MRSTFNLQCAMLFLFLRLVKQHLESQENTNHFLKIFFSCWHGCKVWRPFWQKSIQGGSTDFRMAADLQKLIHMGKILDDKSAVKAFCFGELHPLAATYVMHWITSLFSTQKLRQKTVQTNTSKKQCCFLALSRNSRSMNSIKPACFRMWASKRANSLLSWLPRQDARGWHNVDCGWLEIMRDLHGPLPLQQHWTFNSLSLHSFLLNSPPSIEIRAWRVSAPCVDYSSLTACQLRNLTDHLLLQRSKAKPPAAPAAAPAATPTPAPAPTAGWVQWPEKSEIG